MKKPMMKKGAGGMTKPERHQGKPKARQSGINKPMVKESIPQVVAKVTAGVPTQRQKM